MISLKSNLLQNNSSKFSVRAADVDDDQIISAKDVVEMSRFLLGQIKTFLPETYIDTDEDGLCDYIEKDVLKTNYQLKDTDGDGILDVDELNIKLYTVVGNTLYPQKLKYSYKYQPITEGGVKSLEKTTGEIAESYYHPQTSKVNSNDSNNNGIDEVLKKIELKTICPSYMMSCIRWKAYLMNIWVMFQEKSVQMNQFHFLRQM